MSINLFDFSPRNWVVRRGEESSVAVFSRRVQAGARTGLLSRGFNNPSRAIKLHPQLFNIVDTMEEFASMSVRANRLVQGITRPTGGRALYQLTNFWNRLFVHVEDDIELDGSWQVALNHSTDL